MAMSVKFCLSFQMGRVKINDDVIITLFITRRYPLYNSDAMFLYPLQTVFVCVWGGGGILFSSPSERTNDQIYIFFL